MANCAATVFTGGSVMKPMYISINQVKTGERIKALLKEHGYSVKDIQNVMGFENPQAVYKWLRGQSVPATDNLAILSVVFHTHMDDILVFDGDIPFYEKNAA